MKSHSAKASRDKGKLIVFEGADGTGKTTQAKLLFNHLKKNKRDAVFFSFPNYQSAWGKMVRRYLDGEFGDVNQVSPYLASMLYAGDRLLESERIREWLGLGKLVVCDRYMASNIAHQIAKIKSQSEQSKFVEWLEDLEYRENKIPKPDLIILLTIPETIAQKFMRKRVRDIHEKNVSYQKRVAKAFLDLAKTGKSWAVVSNTKGGGLKKINEVHKEIVEIVKNPKRGLSSSRHNG